MFVNVEKEKYNEGRQNEKDREQLTEGKKRSPEPGAVLKYSEKSFGTAPTPLMNRKNKGFLDNRRTTRNVNK